jgi:hypothetical protein
MVVRDGLLSEEARVYRIEMPIPQKEAWEI